MPKEQEPSSKQTQSSKSNKTSKTGRIVGIGITVGFIILATVYIISGIDPLGLFIPSEETAAPASEELSGVGGDWWDIYFTDPVNMNDPNNLNGSIPEKLIELIDNAEYSIHIASFEFDLDPVAEALIAAHERGVEVQWVTDDEYGIDADEDDGHGQFEMMEDTIVCKNLMTEKGYTPYCGSEFCKPRTHYSPERWPRTKFNGDQFHCPKCGWVSEFPEDFINEYKIKWSK